MPPRIAVLGAGTMGAGIAQVAAQTGHDVLLYDVSDEMLERGLERIRGPLRSRVERGKLSPEELDQTLDRISTTTERDRAAEYDFIIEAAPENIELKREIFSSLSIKTGPNTILATNTSSLSITSIAASAHSPERVVGLHFFNPAPVMQLVEVIAGRQTSSDCVQSAGELARAFGKLPVLSADMPGFIVNRVARPFYGESLRMLGEGTASITQIDAALKMAGFAMGPFELMDLIGIDVNFAVTKSVYDAFFGEPRYRPHPIQQRLVDANTLGRKSGQGFYIYRDGQPSEVAYRPVSPVQHQRNGGLLPSELTQRFLSGGEIYVEDDLSAEIVTRVLAMIINEAASAVGEGVASVRDIDRAMKLGTNYPKGPLRWGDEIGLDVTLEVLRALQETLGDDRYRPSPLLIRLVSSGVTGDDSGGGFRSPGDKGMV
jgi:3-hydroxybutyryl-CoA dehydrogenase